MWMCDGKKLMQMENCYKIQLCVIQEVSGHEKLTALQKYLEVSEQQVEDAIAHLNF
jgi:hypothetical protein